MVRDEPENFLVQEAGDNIDRLTSFFVLVRHKSTYSTKSCSETVPPQIESPAHKSTEAIPRSLLDAPQSPAREIKKGSKIFAALPSSNIVAIHTTIPAASPG